MSGNAGFVHLLLTYDFPPIGGGIARMMGELALHYPPGSLLVSTGSVPESEALDRRLPNLVDRIAVESRRLRTLQGLARWCGRADALARSVGPEFTWCGNLKPAGYPAKWVRTRRQVPYGIFLYGTELLLLRDRLSRSSAKRRVARSLLASASVLVPISRWTADLCRSTLAELDLDPDRFDIRVVPLGTDPARFRPGVDPADVRARYGLEKGRWLLTVARLAAHKGIDTGLRVLAELRDEEPDLRYAVVGSGIKLAELRQLAHELGVAARVRFLTDVPDRDLPGLYNLAELYLGVSRPVELMAEGFGISLSEASACGIPVIGGSAGGIPDAVRDGETGLLVDGADAGAVVSAVRRLLADAELSRRLGAGGRRAVETYYNWNRVTADVVRIGRERAAR